MAKITRITMAMFGKEKLMYRCPKWTGIGKRQHEVSPGWDYECYPSKTRIALDCEQSLISSKIRGKERKISKRVSVAVSVMWERRWREQSRSHAHLFCVLSHGFLRKRETARSLGQRWKLVFKWTTELDILMVYVTVVCKVPVLQ